MPRSVTALRSYSWEKFGRDLIAGITVGLVALPLAMAFAISSGVPPESGIYCAAIAGFLISALGGSMTQIGGPTGAFVVVVAGIVQKHGIDGLFMCTLMAGAMLVLLGVTGLGSAVKYIPRPVVVGFTNGIAVLIASTQIRDFFGLQVEKVPGEFLPRMTVLLDAAGTWQAAPTLLGLACLTLLIALLIRPIRVPGTILALLLGTGAALLMNLQVETIGTRFGGIPSGLPSLQIPQFRPELISVLLAPAVTVAMLGAIESLLSAVVADRMTGDRHNPNVELAAQGVANIVSPLFGGLPATGAIARTATNIRSGAQTPMAGMIHGLTLLAILVFAAPAARHIPLAVLAATLFVVAYTMGEWKEIPQILKLGWSERLVWALTFLLTVFADLTVAVQAGMILAALTYIRRVTETTTVERVTEGYVEDGRRHSLQENPLPEGVAAYRIHGPFLFGSTDKLSVILDDLPSLPPIVLLRLRNTSVIDATGVHALEDLAKRLRAAGRTLVVCGLRDQPGALLHRADLAAHLGEENIQPDLASAIARAREIQQSVRA
ncbi:MAG: SulP family inorganic anion transporter [Fimbriimonadaceae bacterium]|nr:SulP family inorganic anion transporter [Fimbriimonadaceae bacterium]